MATTVQIYNHTMLRFGTGANAAGDTYKLKLYTNSVTFDATDTTLAAAESGATEVSGNGWPAGGFTLTGVEIVVHDTNGFKFDAADVLQAISGGDLGPYRQYIIYNDTDTDNPQLALFTRDADITVENGNSAGFIWDASGIIAVEVV
jgi:hypothetical protein